MVLHQGSLQRRLLKLLTQNDDCNHPSITKLDPESFKVDGTTNCEECGRTFVVRDNHLKNLKYFIAQDIAEEKPKPIQTASMCVECGDKIEGDVMISEGSGPMHMDCWKDYVDSQ